MTTSPLAVASAALPGLAPARVCALAADHDLDGVEWGAGAGQALPVAGADLGAVASGVAAVAAEHDLACAGVAVHEPDALECPRPLWERICEAAVVLGAPHVRVYATELGPDFGRGFAGLRARLAHKAEAAAERGLRLLLEPAPATLVPDPALARCALSGMDDEHVGVVYDPGSLAREGWQDPFLATGVLGPLLRHVHVKNLAPRRTEAGAWVWQRTALDRGIVDWARVSDALGASGYAGWFVLDHLSSPDPGSLAADLGQLRTLTGVRCA